MNDDPTILEMTTFEAIPQYSQSMDGLFKYPFWATVSAITTFVGTSVFPQNYDLAVILIGSGGSGMFLFTVFGMAYYWLITGDVKTKEIHKIFDESPTPTPNLAQAGDILAKKIQTGSHPPEIIISGDEMGILRGTVLHEKINRELAKLKSPERYTIVHTALKYNELINRVGNQWKWTERGLMWVLNIPAN